MNGDPEHKEADEFSFLARPCVLCRLDDEDAKRAGLDNGKLPLAKLYVIGFYRASNGLGPSLVSVCDRKGHLSFPNMYIPEQLKNFLQNGGNDVDSLEDALDTLGGA